MKKIRKNYNQLIKKAMHKPITKESGYVLYAKVDGYKGTEERDSQAEKDAEYIKASVNNYNSPTNIRRLFITGSGVTVQYYSSIVKHGKQDSSKWAVSKLGENSNMFEVAKKMALYDQALNQYNLEKAVNSKAVEPDKLIVEGDVIGSVTGTWVCNNIEEVYFDWTAFLSDDVKPYFQDMCTYENYMSFINKSTQYTEINDKQRLMEFFSAFNSGGVKDLRKRFPRLRTIAMISNLADILDHKAVIKRSTDFIDKNINTLKQTSNKLYENGMYNKYVKVSESMFTWFQMNKALIQASNSIVLMCDLSSDLKKVNTNFILKDNIYKFDKEKLKGVIKSYEEQADAFKRIAKYGYSDEDASKEDDNDTVEITNALEILIKEIEKRENGEALLQNAFKYATMGSGVNKAGREEAFKDITKKTRNHYADYCVISKK